jgi:hypothetical protein
MPSSDADARVSAATWLTRHLADGPRPAGAVIAAAEREGFDAALLRQAEQDMNVEKLMCWALPDELLELL